jgi:hypothetical protein
MKYVQNLLLIIGTTALCTVLGILAVVVVTGLFQRPGQEPWTQAFGQYIGGLVCGAPLGALAGLVGSISFIFSQDETLPWSPIVWMGILLGLLTGVALAVHLGMASGNQWWIAVAVVAVACANAGGVLARMGLALYRFASGTR